MGHLRLTPVASLLPVCLEILHDSVVAAAMGQDEGSIHSAPRSQLDVECLFGLAN